MIRVLLFAIGALLIAGSASAQSLLPPLLPSQGKFTRATPPRINWADPVTAGMSFVLVMDRGINSKPILVSRGTDALGTSNIGLLRSGIAGPMLGWESSTSGQALVTTTETYTMPTTAGTVLAFVIASFSKTDGLQHGVLEISTAGSTPEFSFFKFTNNSWFCGWNNASDTRATAAAAFVSNRPFVAGCTWSATQTILYEDGKSLNTNSSVPSTFSTTSKNLSIGAGNTSAGLPWATGIGDGIMWLAIWDRTLTPPEIVAINADPGSLFLWEEDDLLATLVASIITPNANFFRPAVPW